MMSSGLVLTMYNGTLCNESLHMITLPLHSPYFDVLIVKVVGNNENKKNAIMRLTVFESIRSQFH